MTVLRRLAPTLALVVVWLLLQGEVTTGNVVAGLLVAVAVVGLVPIERASRSHRVHPLRVLALMAHFTRIVVVANLNVLLTIVRPTPARLRAGIVRVELAPTTPLVTTLVANGISLTPGSLTVEASPEGVLHVHLIGYVDQQTVRTDVLDLHRRVLGAFTPHEEGGR